MDKGRSHHHYRADHKTPGNLYSASRAGRHWRNLPAKWRSKSKDQHSWYLPQNNIGLSTVSTVTRSGTTSSSFRAVQLPIIVILYSTSGQALALDLGTRLWRLAAQYLQEFNQVQGAGGASWHTKPWMRACLSILQLQNITRNKDWSVIDLSVYNLSKTDAEHHGSQQFRVLGGCKAATNADGELWVLYNAKHNAKFNSVTYFFNQLNIKEPPS